MKSGSLNLNPYLANTNPTIEDVNITEEVTATAMTKLLKRYKGIGILDQTYLKLYVVKCSGKNLGGMNDISCNGLKAVKTAYRNGKRVISVMSPNKIYKAT